LLPGQLHFFVDRIEGSFGYFQFLFGGFQLLLYLIALQESLSILDVDVENQTENYDHLMEKFERAFTHQNCLVLEAANDIAKQLKIHMPRYHVFLGQFDKHLHHFDPAVATFVQKSFHQKL
jgi:hypothetical protein